MKQSERKGQFIRHRDVCHGRSRRRVYVAAGLLSAETSERRTEQRLCAGEGWGGEAFSSASSRDADTQCSPCGRQKALLSVCARRVQPRHCCCTDQIKSGRERDKIRNQS